MTDIWHNSSLIQSSLEKNPRIQSRAILILMFISQHYLPLFQTQMQWFHPLAENLLPVLFPGPDWLSSRYQTSFFQWAHRWCTQTVCRPARLLIKSETWWQNSLRLSSCRSTVHCSTQYTHSTSLVLGSTVRVTLFGLRVDGVPDRPKSPEISWLNKPSSFSESVDRCGREAAETWESGCKLEIWQFLAATELQTSRCSPVCTRWEQIF